MKNGTIKRFARRAASLLLAALTLVPEGLLTFPARASEINTSETKFVVWDWIEDMQGIGAGADYHPDNEKKSISVGETKYSRIMFYQSVGGDRYYFNADPGSHPGTESKYAEDKIYLDAQSRVGNSAHREWNQDLAENDCFITLGGERTPYIQYAQTVHDFHSWRLWVANKDDTCSDHTLCLVDDYENLDVRRTLGGFSNPYIVYGAKAESFRSDPWIIAKTAHIVPASYWAGYDNCTIWHWDNDTGGYDEALDFDLGDRKFKAYNIDLAAKVEEFKIFLGKEYKVGTLAEDFTVQGDQNQTLGRPLYYIPKGKTITVAKDGVLTIDGVLLNDGEIVVKDGGLLVVKDGAKIMPFTKYDNNCGKITSYGSVYIGEDAMLCGGATNGIRILGGGVINFGVMAAEDFYVSENYAIDNRESGWVIAGKSPSRAFRIKFIRDAISNEGVADLADPTKDFVKIGNVDSRYNIPANGIYGNTKNVVKSGEKATGSPSDPTLSVYTRAKPGEDYTPVFVDAKLDSVSMRVSGGKVIYTAEGTEYIIENKLVAASVGRGDKEREIIFTDLWAGGVDGGYLQLEPACAPGMRLALSGGSTGNGTNAVIWEADSGTDKLWHFVKSGSSGASTTYRINSGKDKNDKQTLDVPGTGSAKAGDNVQLYEQDGGSDQRWFLVSDPNSNEYYYIRSAANTGVSLDVTGKGTANGTNVQVYTNSTSDAQRWRIANLFTEDAYGSAVSAGVAVEFIPQHATKQRLAAASGAEGANVWIYESNQKTDQRWNIQQAGTENLDGVVTPFYTIANMDTGKVLEIADGKYQDGANVVARDAKWAGEAGAQYWYLQEAGGSECYYIVARGNTNFVLEVRDSGTGNGVNVQIRTKTAGALNQKWQAAGLDNVMAETQRQIREAAGDRYSGKTYLLEPTNMEGQAMDGGGLNTSVAFQTKNAASDSQRMTFVRAGTDDAGGSSRTYYQIVSAFNGAAVQYPDLSYNEVKCSMRSAELANKGQHWYVDVYEDGTIAIVPREHPEQTLGKVHDPTAVGSAASKWYVGPVPTDSADALRWKLTDLTDERLSGKYVALEPKHAPGMYLAPQRDTTTSESLCIRKAAVSGNMEWRIKMMGSDPVKNEDGTETSRPYYTISYYTYNQSVTVSYSGNKPRSGSGVRQDGAAAQMRGQLWYIDDAGDGYYRIACRDDPSLVLDVNGGGTADKTGVIVSTRKDSNGENQMWRLVGLDTTADGSDAFDGKVFTLAPGHAADMRLALAAYSTANGTQMVIYDALEHESQRWRFVKMGTEYQNGKKLSYYRIESVYAPGMALDTSGSLSDGARPHIWTSDTSNKNQYWFVQHTGGGWYYIVPRADTTKCLDVTQKGAANNTGVMLTTQNGGSNQKWRLIETIEPETVGTYELEPKHAPGMALGTNSNNANNGTALGIWTSHWIDYAQWTLVKMGVEPNGRAYYKLVCKANGKIVDMPGGPSDIANGKAMQQWDYDGRDDNLWYLEVAEEADNGDIWYHIRSRADRSYCLEVSGSGKTDGTRAQLGTVGSADNQKWKLNEKFEPVEIGTYEFGPVHASALRLDLSDAGSKKNGDNIRLWSRNNESPAWWIGESWTIRQMGVEPDGKPFYTIYNAWSGKALDPIGVGTATAGVNVQTYDYDGYKDQHWYMEVQSDNSVVFLNRANSKLCLEAANAGTAIGTNVQLGTYTAGRKNQRWQLHPVMLTNGDGQYYIPGSRAAVDAGIPFAEAEDTILNPVAGKFTLTPQHATGLRMDLYNADTSNGKAIWAYTNNGGGAQRWRIIPRGVDYHDGEGRIFYEIAYGSDANKSFDLAGDGKAAEAGLSLVLYDYQADYDHLWYLEPAATGEGKDSVYYLIARGTMTEASSKICLEVSAGATASGSPIKTATLRNKSYQQWALEPVD